MLLIVNTMPMDDPAALGAVGCKTIRTEIRNVGYSRPEKAVYPAFFRYGRKERAEKVEKDFKYCCMIEETKDRGEK